jgi:hypothetical protein
VAQLEETGIPEDMTIYADGEVRYRNLLHTQQGIRVISDRLAPARLARIRRALDAIDLTHVDASSLEPRRSGFRYVIRSHGHVGTAVDGHLRGRDQTARAGVARADGPPSGEEPLNPAATVKRSRAGALALPAASVATTLRR